MAQASPAGEERSALLLELEERLAPSQADRVSATAAAEEAQPSEEELFAEEVGSGVRKELDTEKANRVAAKGVAAMAALTGLQWAPRCLALADAAAKTPTLLPNAHAALR